LCFTQSSNAMLSTAIAAALLIIGTICDIPATLLNAADNLVAPLLVQRIIPNSHSVCRSSGL